jgi:hypothetical protein
MEKSTRNQVEKARCALRLGHARLLGKLAEALFESYLDAGSFSDLEETLELDRRVLDLISEDDQDLRASVLTRLGRSLKAVYDRSGDLASIQEAIARHEQALCNLSPHSNILTEVEAGLAEALSVRHRYLGNENDQDRVGEMLTRAVSRGPGHSFYPYAVAQMILARREKFALSIEEMHRLRHALADIEASDYPKSHALLCLLAHSNVLF